MTDKSIVADAAAEVLGEDCIISEDAVVVANEALPALDFPDPEDIVPGKSINMQDGMMYLVIYQASEEDGALGIEMASLPAKVSSEVQLISYGIYQTLLDNPDFLYTAGVKFASLNAKVKEQAEKDVKGDKK